NDLRDMARVENVGDAHDMALVENERRMNQGRIHDVGEAQEAAIAENEAYNQDAAANAAEEEARQAEAEAVRIAEEGRIEGIRAQREALVAAMEGPRDEYLRRVAGNARRGIHWKKEFRKSGVEEARKEYEEARSRLLGFEAAQIRAIGAGAEGDMGEEAIQTEINDVATRLSFSEERDMARALLGHRLVATGQYVREDDGTVTKIERTGMRKVMNKFYDWYARNNAGGKYGKLGMFVKHATVGAAFGAVGLAAGAVLAPTSVGLLGALGGAEVVRRLTRGYMVAHARKSSTELSDTFAARQTQELLNRIGSGTSGKSAVEHVGSMRRREVFRNNARNIITVGSAALFGSGGAALSEHINLGDKVVAGYDRVKDWFADKEVGKTAVAPNISGDTTNGTPYGTDYVPPKPESPVDVGVDTDNGPDFTPTVNVEAGHGYTQELQDLFAQKDINLDGDQSYALYEHLEKQFPGGRFFTDNPSYNMNGDFGIQHPGESTWRPEVLRAIDQWAEDNDVRN
ncbi:hypothetical protein KBC77_01885, partial [Candidatus Saccharibacteria bacterium]|nr:hypothetical protein [Candidatus Saccharibacteria bacterium]